MQTIDEIIEYLKNNLSEKRFAHTMGVAKTAQSLAETWGADSSSAFLAGLVHDCAKEVPFSDMLRLMTKYDYTLDDIERESVAILHAPCGAFLAEEVFGIKDRSILDAVKFHTVGRPDMTLLEKVIYVADFIEPTRCHKEAEALRQLAYKDLDKAVLCESDMVIKFTIDRGKAVHPATIITRNYYLKLTEEGKKNEA